MSKVKRPRFTTPKGPLGFPWITKPDTKFNKSGVYQTEITIPGELFEAPLKKHKNEEFKGRSLKDIFDEMADAAYEEGYASAVEAAKKKRKKLESYTKTLPYREELDEDGEETGNYILTAKLNRVIKLPDGKVIKQKPEVVDAKKNPVTEPVFSGSVAKLIVETNPYSNSEKAGLSLRLKAVQVLELSTFSAASDFDEEEGFESSGESGEDFDGDHDDDSGDNEIDDSGENDPVDDDF